MTKGSTERISQKLYDDVKQLMGVPLGQPSLEVGAAISCAFDMGYRTPYSLAQMARKLIAGAPSAFGETTQERTEKK